MDNSWAKSLGLTEEWQVDLYWRLHQTAEENGIPPEDLPALVRNLDRIDFATIVADPSEVAERLGVVHSHLQNLVESDPDWMFPMLWIRDSETGRTKFRVWLIDKIEHYARLRDESSKPRLAYWRKRKQE